MFNNMATSVPTAFRTAAQPSTNVRWCQSRSDVAIRATSASADCVTWTTTVCFCQQSMALRFWMSMQLEIRRNPFWPASNLVWGGMEAPYRMVMSSKPTMNTMLMIKILRWCKSFFKSRPFFKWEVSRGWPGSITCRLLEDFWVWSLEWE